MILRPQHHLQMVQMLKALPQERRKSIVLVGRHRNEGTLKLAEEHHEKWERHGAVVIQIPLHWTPEGFWHAIKKEGVSVESPEFASRISRVRSDSHIIKFLAKHNFNVPIVNFHGTSLASERMQNPKTKAALDFFVCKYSFIPPGVPFIGHNGINVFGPPPRPQEVLAEFYYPGNARRRLQSRVRSPAPSGWKKKFPRFYIDFRQIGQLDEGYLKDHIAGQKARKLFGKKFAKQFEGLLKHLAENGLLKEPREYE